MQPHSQQLGLIAHELALDISEAAFAPDIIEHIPGIANTAADALSRKCDPYKRVAIPNYLTEATRHICKPREMSWWRSLAPPA